MRVLFIGGTGNISTACTRRAIESNIELFHLNRGSQIEKTPEGVTTLRADIHNSAEVQRALQGLRFDSVVQWIAYEPEQIALDLELFRARTAQYVFISSASVYRKPLSHPVITESTPRGNPYWEYAAKKIACERVLEGAGEESGFPYTIVRPSHTYDNGWIPSPFGSRTYTVASRILAGKEIVVHGDGQSLWTLTHASDFAVGLVGLLAKPAALGETFHITSDESMTWDGIYTAIGQALGATPRMVHVTSEFIARVCPSRAGCLLGDMAYSVLFDNSKIKRHVPAFRPAIDAVRGLRESIEWLNAHPERKQIDRTAEAEQEAILSAWRKAMNAAMS